MYKASEWLCVPFPELWWQGMVFIIYHRVILCSFGMNDYEVWEEEESRDNCGTLISDIQVIFSWVSLLIFKLIRDVWLLLKTRKKENSTETNTNIHLGRSKRTEVPHAYLKLRSNLVLRKSWRISVDLFGCNIWHRAPDSWNVCEKALGLAHFFSC